MVRSEAPADPAASITRRGTWAAVRVGTSRLSASANASTSTAVVGPPGRGLGTNAPSPPAR